MIKKVRYILLFMSLSVCLGLMSSTYSRYVASSQSNIEALFAKWQILVNKEDVTKNTSTEITFTPTVEENQHIKSNVMAPSSKGYFDIEIDPTNVDVSFKYSITLAIENQNMPDLMITKYSIIPESYDGSSQLPMVNIENSLITNTLNFDKNTEGFKFETFTVRVYFEWYEGQNESMDNIKDTEIGNKAATENTKFTISANISFEQKI